ncbi:SPFH domain-containing protein [Chitinimonas sp.]|uniref:SPFH domain-containing protein n=1 Tax=Chitinimonas sp. TaxID=1934313 RepID=UPI0035AF86E3
MSEAVKVIVQAVRDSFNRVGSVMADNAVVLRRNGRRLIVVGLLGASGWAIATHLPFQNVGRGEAGVRVNQLTGAVSEFREGSVLVLPGLHQLRRYSLRDQLYRPTQSSRANGDAPFQSIEGLSLGVDLTIRYALDPSRIAATSKNLPDNIGGEVVEPAVQGVMYKTFTRYTVKEIFSTKRGEIQQSIETELKPRLAADGILLRGVLIGKVDLPADYRNGMDRLLAEELETEKMRFTLELKEKRVKQNELEAEAEKVRKEKAAEAAGNEQIIAAKAQEEAMKHVLPFKQKQIEQRSLEAEAEKQARIKTAEATAQARTIEAVGEADSRRKLADAEIYRMEKLGKTTSEQMARDGALISKHPLLIQKTLADKLSDKIQVIIAPPPADGGFIGSTLLGASAQKVPAAQAPTEPEAGDANTESKQ